MSVYMDISKAILSVLQKLRKPTEVDEIAFRVRATPSVVKEQLDRLAEVHLVKKQDSGYTIDDSARSSFVESIYSY